MNLNYFNFFLELLSSKVVSEEFFCGILKASPLTNPFFVRAGRFPFV